MAIKKYTAIADNTITNAWLSDFTTRATGSNMGKADILEVYSIFQRAYTSSAENKRFKLCWLLLKKSAIFSLNFRSLFAPLCIS